jgi:hypothetical protein
LAQALEDVGYRVPIRQFFVGKHFVAYELPREFDGLLHEARATALHGGGRRFGHSLNCWGRTSKFTECTDTGGTLLWVYIPPDEATAPPADDVMVMELRPRPDYTVYPYKVHRVRRPKEATT